MKVFNIRAVKGSYKDKNGNEKQSWITIGKLFEKDGKLSGVIETLPVNFSGSFIVLEDNGRDKPTQEAPASVITSPQMNEENPDDDLPF